MEAERNMVKENSASALNEVTHSAAEAEKRQCVSIA